MPVLAAKYALGSALILAMTIGGGTRSGLLTDLIVEIVTIAAAMYVVSKPSENGVSKAGLTIATLAVLSIAMQLVPLPSDTLIALRPAPISDAMAQAENWFSFATLSVSHTVYALTSATALALFFVAIGRLRHEDIIGIIPFFLVGVICNAVAGAIQFSISDSVVIDDLLSYQITSGFYANINHFSTLMFVTIPILVYYWIVRGNTAFSLLSICGILLLLLAAGSRAGVAIGLAIFIISLVFLPMRGRANVALIVFLLAVVGIYLVGARTNFQDGLTEDSRLSFVKATWQGIQENWLLGIGYGNFENAYRIYEKPEQIASYFVNHAHNEYVQLVFEGGIVAGLLIVAYLIALHVQMWRRGDELLRKAAYLGIVFMLVHSLVDYPLRTSGLAMTFVLFNAIVFYNGSFSRRERARLEAPEVDGDEVVISVHPTYEAVDS